MACASAVSKRLLEETIPFTFATASAFAVFFYTLCPTVYAGDSGELVLACEVLGTPHPPGYPLFVLAGRLFCALGFAESAYLTNAMSATFGALTTGLLFLLLRRVTGVMLVSLSAALSFSLSATFWGQAVVTEVYTSVCLGFLTLLLAVEAIDRKGTGRLLYLLAYLTGLACVLHQSMILFLPVVIYVFYHFNKRMRMGVALLLYLLGLTPYLVLLVNAHVDPAINWGDPEGPSALLQLLLRRTYGPLQQNPVSLGLFMVNIQAFFSLLMKEFPILLLIFSPFGIFYLAKKRELFCKATCIAFFSLLFGLIGLINPYPDSVHLYQMSFLYLPLYVLFAVWIGAGLAHVIEWIAKHASRERPLIAKEDADWPKRRFLPKSAVHVVLCLALLSAPAWMLISNASINNRSDFFDARVYGENILRTLPKGAVLFVDGDNESFVTAYLQLALGVRPDVTIHHRKGYIFSAPQYLKTSSRDDLQKNVLRWEREVLESRKDVFFATYCDLSSLESWMLEREGILFRAARRLPAPNEGMAGSLSVGSELSGKLDTWDRRTRRDATFDARRRMMHTRARLVSCDMGVLERDPRRLDFIVRKFAIGYLQSLWDFERAAKRDDSADRILRAIADVGFDFPEAQYLFGFEMEKRGELLRAYEAYLSAARLDPRAPFPRRGMERVVAHLNHLAAED